MGSALFVYMPSRYITSRRHFHLGKALGGKPSRPRLHRSRRRASLDAHANGLVLSYAGVAASPLVSDNKVEAVSLRLEVVADCCSMAAATLVVLTLTSEILLVICSVDSTTRRCWTVDR